MNSLSRCCLAVGAAVGLSLVAACPPNPIPGGDPSCTNGGAVPPGDTIMGIFEFYTRVDPATTCPPTHEDVRDTLDGGLSFTLILSRDTISGQAWLTTDGYARCANYSRQTQTFTSSFEAPIPLRSCFGTCKTSRMSEELELVVLSRSQSLLVEDRCERLERGVLPTGPGVTPPAPTFNGYDTWRACGTMIVEFNPPDAGCVCSKPACKAVYQLEGIRRYQ